MRKGGRGGGKTKKNEGQGGRECAAHEFILSKVHERFEALMMTRNI